MKGLFFLIIFVSIPVSSFAQSGSITSGDARRIAEKFVSCSGYTTRTLHQVQCGGWNVSCDDHTFPCKFLETKAFGYFPERQNGEKGWTIVFRTRGKLKSRTTGTKITMNLDGSKVKIEETKVFLKFVENKY
ncbi:hypothetical protein BH10ACI3_BH10ACI3_06990 [soil metagenome]